MPHEIFYWNNVTPNISRLLIRGVEIKSTVILLILDVLFVRLDPDELIKN